VRMFLTVEMDAPSASLSVVVPLRRKVMRCRIFACVVEAAHVLLSKLAESSRSCQGKVTGKF
jgi:hypothetical protein